MKKLIIFLSVAITAIGAFADIPSLGQLFSINGRLMFTLTAYGSNGIVFQRKVGTTWITQSFDYNDGYYISTDMTYMGTEHVRFGNATGTSDLPTDWNEQEVNAGYAVTPTEIWDLCNHGGYWNSPAYAFDGYASSIFHIPDQGNEDHSIYADLGEAKILIGGAILARSGFNTRVGTPVFEGSNTKDFSNSDDIVAFYSVPSTSVFANRYATFEFTTTNSIGVRYVRLRPNGGDNYDGWFNVAELEFRELPSDLDMTVGEVTTSEGVISSIAFDFDGVSGGEKLYIAYGKNPIATGSYDSWEHYGVARTLVAGDDKIVFSDFPSGMGTDYLYFKFFFESEDKVIDSSDAYAFDNEDFPLFYGLATLSGYTYGDTIGVSGSMLSIGSGDEDTMLKVEMSESDDFSEYSVWDCSIGSGNSYSAIIRDTDSTSPTYIKPSTTYYLRVKAVDGNGHVAYSLTTSMPVGANFNAGPQLWDSAVVINGRLAVPLSGDVSTYIIQRKTGDEWITVENFFAVNSYMYSPDQSLQGSSSWRVAYKPTVSGVTEPTFWTYINVDAGYPIFGKTLCVGGYYPEWGCSEDGAYDGCFYTRYEPNASSWATEKMWVGVDFGSVREITGIRYCRRWDSTGCVGAIFQYADNPDFTNAVDVYTIPDPGSNAIQSVPSSNFPVQARYMRVYLPPGGWFHIGEVEYSVAEDDANLKVVNAGDVPDGRPVVSVSERFSSEYGFCIYRSRKADSAFELVATLDGSVTEWTDNDSSLRYGLPYYYKVARRDAEGKVVSTKEIQTVDIIMYRWLEGRKSDVATPNGTMQSIEQGTIFCLETNETCYPTTNNVYWIFDNDVGTFADFYYNSYGNPRIGIDFGSKPVHVAKFMLYPRENYLYRSEGLSLYGSNSTSHDAATIIEAGTNLTSSATAGVNALQWFTFDADPTDAYRVFFLKSSNEQWCGGLGELRFYGYTDKDITNGGLYIYIK